MSQVELAPFRRRIHPTPRAEPPAGSARERTPRPSRVLIVEDQPVASILFAEEGYVVENKSHAEIIATEAMHVNHDIKKPVYDTVWLAMPYRAKVPNLKAAACSKMLSLWFRTAAITGILAIMVGPRGNAWTDPNITALIEEGGRRCHHIVCVTLKKRTAKTMCYQVLAHTPCYALRR